MANIAGAVDSMTYKTVNSRSCDSSFGHSVWNTNYRPNSIFDRCTRRWWPRQRMSHSMCTESTTSICSEQYSRLANTAADNWPKTKMTKNKKCVHFKDNFEWRIHFSNATLTRINLAYSWKVIAKNRQNQSIALIWLRLFVAPKLQDHHRLHCVREFNSILFRASTKMMSGLFVSMRFADTIHLHHKQ